MPVQLRLTNAKNTGYFGGFAAKKMWTTKAYNHVIQLGTKWRLSGVGDKIKNDDWLRLMDVQNTKLSGGIMALKMQSSRLEVHLSAIYPPDHMPCGDLFAVVFEK